MLNTRTRCINPARPPAGGALALLIVFAVAGCSSQSLPENVGQVTGKVTLAGEPLADALVTFAPVAQGGTTSLGRTDANGVYKLNYARDVDGAQIGENRVLISTYSAGNPEGDPPRPAVPEKVPAKYNTNTELKADVKSGSNTIDFSLEAGPVVQPGAARRGQDE
jgi:hypothetical protein